MCDVGLNPDIRLREVRRRTPCRATKVNNKNTTHAIRYIGLPALKKKGMAQSYETVLNTVSQLQNQELSIIRLSEPIAAPNAPDAPKRTSDVSADALENPSPASLAADLGHYKVPFAITCTYRLAQV